MTTFKVIPKVEMVLPVDIYKHNRYVRQGRLIITDRKITYYRRGQKMGHPTMEMTLPAFCKFLDKHFPE